MIVRAPRGGLPPVTALILTFLGTLLMTGAPASAGRPQRYTLAEMTRAAESIVVGRVSEVRVGVHPRYSRIPVTFVTIAVEQTWKGTARKKLTFMQFGDAAADGAPTVGGSVAARPYWIEELPSYRAGEEAVLYLRRPSGEGFSSPVGAHAGKLTLRRATVGGERSVSTTVADRTLSPSSSGIPVRVTLERLRTRTVSLVTQGGSVQ